MNIIKEGKYFIYDTAQKSGLKKIAKDVCYNMISAFYRMKMSFITTKSEDRKYGVSICAIFKNESPYLKEWIEYNHIVGIDHFFLYNNNSEDDYISVLQPYIDNGIVTLCQWPHNQKQMECYMDCIENYSSETQWLGFIDIDEFIVPKSTDNIHDFLKPFEKKYGSVMIYWRLYGSSGLMNRDLSDYVSESFTVCWPKYCNIGKCFYNTRFGFDKTSKHTNQLHHRFWANWKGKDIPPVNIFGKICVGTRNVANTSDSPIQINHYFNY